MNTIFEKYRPSTLIYSIVVVALLLRFFSLSDTPVSLYWDEVSIGYNAYSIALTGKDEYGESLPLLFRAYDDYKFPGYIYLTTVIVKLFGLSEFTTRFTSAFLGTLTVFVLYFLIKELFIYTMKNPPIRSTAIALIASGLLAISPWHIQFSRAAFEANAGLFFVVLGIYLLVKGLEKNLLFFIGVIVLSISMYFYRSILMFTPLIFLVYIVCFYTIRFDKKRVINLIYGIVLFIVVSSPILIASFSPQGLKRAQEVNIFTNSNEDISYGASRIQESNNALVAKIVYNRRVIYLEKIISNYIAHFNPLYLFVHGDKNYRHRSYGLGQMYLWELPFLILGVFALRKYDKRWRAFLLAWLFVAPIPASITIDAPHALRTLNIVPILYTLVAIGIVESLEYTKSYHKVYIRALSVIVVIFFSYYVGTYYSQYRTTSASVWADGYKKLVEYVEKNEDNFAQIAISGYKWQPYMYFLFYTKTDPSYYQLQGNKTQYGKYIFGGTTWDRQGYSEDLSKNDFLNYTAKKPLLVVLSPAEFMRHRELIKIKTIKDSAGDTVFVVGRVK